MAVSSLQISAAPAADPNAGKPPANVIDTATGVVVDPNQPTGTPVDTSKLILGKFKDHAELEKAYTESQQKITELSTKPNAGDVAGAAEAAKAAAEKAGIDMSALSKEYAEKGSLSPETMKGLADKGVTQAHVDAYIGGLKAQASQLKTTLTEVAGGEDGLKNVYDWAATNLSADELAAYNATVESGNLLGSKLALTGIVARFTAANGTEPALLKETSTVHTGVQPYKSNAQITEAMSDPRYNNDPAYRASVAARLDVTDMSFPR